jgi:O-antigen/teichoic acid export membrane protein
MTPSAHSSKDVPAFGTVRVGILAMIAGRVRSMFADRLARNVGWYGLAELGNRVTRLVTTIVLARWLIPQDYGVAAIAITAFEIVRVIAQNGIGQAVVRTHQSKLPGVLRTAHRASWLMCFVSMSLLCLTGVVASFITGRSELAVMMFCLSGVLFTLPFGQIQAHLIVRDNRLHVLAGIAVVQMALDNALTAIFAIYGFGPWAVVLPKLLTAPIWVIGMRRAQTWTPDKTATPAPMAEIMSFAAPIIGSELLVAARFNVDKLLVGFFLGIEALGIYYFVFNAGIGFSLSITGALSASIYPHLAELSAKPREMLARFDRLVWTAVFPCSAVIALQAVGAFIYVPIVFGSSWESSAPLVAILCGSAIAKPAFDAASQLLRAFGQPQRELYGSVGLTVLSLTALCVALPLGLPTAVAVLSLTMFVAQFAFAIWVRGALGRPTFTTPMTDPLRPILARVPKPSNAGVPT